MTLTDEQQERLFRVGVYELAEGLRGQHSGSSDPWRDEDIAEVVAYLRKRLADWRPSGPLWERFDNAVRECIEAALAEIEQP